MRVIVAGLGVQGRKRKRFAGGDYVASVDPVGDEADYKNLRDVPLDRYDAVLACIPDEPKLDLVRTCIENGKHVLVEKPLWTSRDEDISELERVARARGVICLHRLQPPLRAAFRAHARVIASGELGAHLSTAACSTGTERRGWCAIPNGVTRARGVIPDLGSHLLDTAASGSATSATDVAS